MRQVTAADAAAYLHALHSRLTPMQYTVWELHYIGFSFRQIAHRVRRSVSTVHQHYQYAQRKLGRSQREVYD